MNKYIIFENGMVTVDLTEFLKSEEGQAMVSRVAECNFFSGEPFFDATDPTLDNPEQK